MACVFPLVATLLFLGLVVHPAQGLPTARRSGVTSGAASERGLPNMAAGSAEARAPMKRTDLSINQELMSLANLLNTNEYYRVRSNNLNRAFLRKIGKRAGSTSAEEDLDVDGDVLRLLPWGALEESWSRW